MRLIVNGQQAFCKATIDAIVEKGTDEIVAVYTAPDKEGRPVDAAKEAAEAHGIPCIQPDNYSDAAVLEEMRSFDADLMVMAYMIIFVPEEARNVPKHGSICFHPSLLPAHRGPSSINWPIIWGRTETGLTIFYPDDGLDEGEILLQKHVDIEPDATLGSIYFDKIFPMGVAACLEAIDLIRDGKAPRIAQDDSKATYEGWANKKIAQVDWNRSVDEVYNLIRGCDPQPGAWTTLNGEEVQLYDCRKVEAYGRTGKVHAIDDDGFVITAGLGGVKVGRVRPAGGKKMAAKDYVAEKEISVGTKFGT
jgi:methionyl-tRNA formyltransferase